MQDRHPTGAKGTRASVAAIIALTAAVIAVALRWYFVTHAQVLQPLDSPNVRADAAEYYRYAWNLIHHGVFSSSIPGTPAPSPDSFRDPGYPIFLALWMVVFPTYEAWYAAVLLSQAVLGGILVVCLVFAMRHALPAWILGAMAALAAAWPHGVAMTAYVLSENLTAVMSVAVLLAIQAMARRPAAWRCVISGLTLAAAGLTNAVLAPLFVPIAIALAWKRVIPLRGIAILVIAACLPLGGWALRNAAVASNASSTGRAEQNFVQGSWPIYHDAYQLSTHNDPDGLRAMREIDGETRLLHADTAAGLDSMWDRIGKQPWMYVRWYVQKPALLWGWNIRVGQGDIYVYPTRNSPYMDTPSFKAMENTAFLLNPILAILALAGTAIACTRRDAPAAILGAGVVAAWVTFVYGVLQSEPRYAIPYRGLEIALACFAVACASGWVRKRLPARALHR